MQARTENPLPGQTFAVSCDGWLRKHADYQRVYRDGKRRSAPLMTYFFAPRYQFEKQEQQMEISPGAIVTGIRSNAPKYRESGSRVGLTAGRVLGNAVQRNRIKRRMRAAVRLHRAELTADIDLVLHPRRSVLDAPFADIERAVSGAFREAQAATQAVQNPPKSAK